MLQLARGQGGEGGGRERGGGGDLLLAFIARSVCLLQEGPLPFCPILHLPAASGGGQKVSPLPSSHRRPKVFPLPLVAHRRRGRVAFFLGGGAKGMRGKDGTREKNSIHMEEEEVVFLARWEEPEKGCQKIQSSFPRILRLK